MPTSVLTELVGSLSAWEKRHFRVWLESPCYNRRLETIRLFNFYTDDGNRRPSADLALAAEVVFGKNDPALLPKLRHELTLLTRLLRRFLLMQELEASPAQRELLLLKALRKRGMEKNFQAVSRETEKLLQPSNRRSYHRHLDQFHLRLEQYAREEQSTRGAEVPWDDLRADLDAWYAGQLLHLACSAQAQRNVSRKEQQQAALPISIDGLLDQLQNKPHLNRPEVTLYYLGHRMLAHPEEKEYIEQFQTLLEQQIDVVSPEEGRDLFMLAINHGIRRINAGDPAAILHTRGFYLLGLQKKLLHDNRGYITKYTYNNALMTFVALSEWENALSFLNQYRQDLPPDERENVYCYNLAVYHFRRGQYDPALELLRDVGFTDPMYNLESRKMLLIMYYEQQFFSALESVLDNLLTWLRRHAEIGYHRNMYRNLAVFTRKLIRLAPSDAEGRTRLRVKILNTPQVAERRWLLEKIAALD